MEIPASSAGRIAKMFEDEGFDVTYSAPLQKRAGGLANELVQIVYYLKDNGGAGIVGGAAYAGVQRVVNRLRERAPDLKVEVKDDDGDI